MRSLILTMVAIISLTGAASAQYESTHITEMTSYQGMLTDGSGSPLDGTYSVAFRIYNDSLAGVLIWEEQQDVEVSDGLFSVQLGSVQPLEPQVLGSHLRWLEIQVEGEPAMTPRQMLTVVFVIFI